MLGKFLNKSLYLSLRCNGKIVITRLNTVKAQAPGSSVRLFTATNKLKASGVISSNNTDTPANISFLDSIKVEDRADRIFCNKFRDEMDKFSKKGDWKSILDLCEGVKKSNRKPDLFIYNMILHAYIPLGSIKNSFKILEDMKFANVKPNLTTYHYLLRTYTQTPSNEQDPYLREQILEMIVNDGLQPNSKTYECYIDSILAGEEYERAFEVFDSLKSKNIYPQLELYVAMIRKAISVNESEIALNYLKSLEQNQLVYIPSSLYNDVIRLCAYEYDLDGVLYCWGKIKHRGLNLDEGACIDILYCAGNKGKPDLAIQVIEYLMDVRKLKLYKLHFNPLIQAYVNIGDIKNAMESLNIMRQAGFQVGLSDTSSNGIHSLIQKDKETIDKAYYCLEELHSEGKVIDVSALNAIIAACSNIGGKKNFDVIRVLETYKAAEKLGIKPNAETFSSLLLVCYLAKRKDLADQLWNEMQELGIIPSIMTYSRMIQVISTQDNYEEIFVYLEDMKSKNILPPQDIYEKIIRTCVLHNDTRAMLALEEMENFNYKLSYKLRRELRNGGFDVNLIKRNIRRQQRDKNNNKDNRIEVNTQVKDSDVMDEFVNLIASKVNENEQK